jgi:CheY-like chemotaxis protein
MAPARLLVVDDETAVLRAVRAMLSRVGYEVLLAAGARQALEIVRNDPLIDLMLTDVTMPEMQGTALVREIAQISPRTASMLMTGGGVDPSALPEGVPLLRKPFSASKLISAVQEVLAGSVQARDGLVVERERSAELRRENRRLRDDLNDVVVAALLADLDAALALTDWTEASGTAAPARRNQESALATYHAVLRLLPRLKLEAPQRQALDDKLALLKTRLDPAVSE